MNKKYLSSILIPLVVVLVGGLLITVIAWFTYLGIVLSIEGLFYPDNPMNVPMGLFSYFIHSWFDWCDTSYFSFKSS